MPSRKILWNPDKCCHLKFKEKNVSIAEGKVFHRREDINVFHQDLLSSLGMGEKVSRKFPTELWMRLGNSVRDDRGE